MLSTSKIAVESTGNGLAVKASCRGFEITFDEPCEMGGTNTGMNPVEGLLCSFAACQTIATLIFAGAQNIPLEGVRIEAEGDLDPDGFMGANPDVRNGLQEVRFTVHVKCEDEEAAKKLADLAEKQCPVSDCLKNPVPVIRTDLVIEH